MAEETGDRVARIQSEWRRERPDIDVSPQGVIGRLHRLAGALTHELVAVYRQHGLGEGEFDVLATLRRSGAPYERAPGDLAAHTMVTTGAMSKRIDRLEAEGLVSRRQADPTEEGVIDGRRRLVALTPAGLELIDAAFADHMANEARLVAELDPADRADLERILTRWLARHESP
ncbi:MarR family winged helix-turn-helix transcriptional regulator [Herbiconiux liukaitaii]|uniref:MarR family winged helix-turn-helix transcriptional regulator n=1 Tax=Herbiconiux liukaitaii TaxID=3342799 RepID=UPI0035B73265